MWYKEGARPWRILWPEGWAAVLSLVIGVGETGLARGIEMADPISVQLTIERSEAIRGESVYFRAVIVNVSAKAIKEAWTLDPHNRALVLEARGPQETFRATQWTRVEREGLYAHGPKGPQTGVLEPGVKLQLREDLLLWFGELPPGPYQIVASYEGAGRTFSSQAVQLVVLPADPVIVTTPRYGRRLASAPLAAAWVHRLGPRDPDAGKFAIFYQEQSQNLPRSPVHCVRLAVVPKPIEPLASTLSAPGIDRRHLVWSDGKKLMAGVISIEEPELSRQSAIPTHFVGLPDPSPLTRSDGTLLVPMRDGAGAHAAVVVVPVQGTVRSLEVPLKDHTPMGPHVWFWGNDARLHLLWAKPRGREVLSIRLPLDDLDAGFSTAALQDLDRPILWLEAYLDLDAALARRSPGAETPPSDLVAWAVLEGAGGITCARANLTIHQIQSEWSFPTKSTGNLTVACSVVTKENHLALLFKNERGILYYGSTRIREIRPLVDAAGAPIQTAQFPSLIAAGEDGVFPWVYVRYLDPSGHRIAYATLEPSGEHDPMDGPRPLPEQETKDEEGSH